MLKEMYSTELRDHLGEVLDEVEKTKFPVITKKKVAGGSKEYAIISRAILQHKILRYLVKDEFLVEVYKEQDNTVTLSMPFFGIAVNGENINEATKELIEDLKMYAEDYKKDIDAYLKSPNRKDHLIPLLQLSFCDTDEEIIKLLKYNNNG